MCKYTERRSFKRFLKHVAAVIRKNEECSFLPPGRWFFKYKGYRYYPVGLKAAVYDFQHMQSSYPDYMIQLCAPLPLQIKDRKKWKIVKQYFRIKMLEEA